MDHDLIIKNVIKRLTTSWENIFKYPYDELFEEHREEMYELLEDYSRELKFNGAMNLLKYIYDNSRSIMGPSDKTLDRSSKFKAFVLFTFMCIKTEELLEEKHSIYHNRIRL